MPENLRLDRMFADCDGSVWTHDDFSACFQRDFLCTLFPLLVSGTSILYILISWAVRPDYLSTSHSHKTVEGAKCTHSDGSEYEGQSDLPDRIQSNGGLGGDDLSIPYKTGSRIVESVVNVDHPKGENVVAAAETIAVAGEVSIHLASLLMHARSGGGTIPAIAGLSAWIYIAALVLLRQLFAKFQPVKSRNLWNQTAVLYGLQWLFMALLFRSAILHPRPRVPQGLIIADFVLATVLLLITIGSRKGNRPFALEYEDNIAPSQEPLASLFSIATFTWVDAIVWHGYKKTYEIADVWNLAPRDKAIAVLAGYRQMKKTTSLALHLVKYFKRELLLQGFWAILVGFLTFVPTLLLKAILEFVENPQDTPINAAWFYVALLACSSIAEGIANGQALWRGRKICIRLHAIIIGEVYAKTLKRKAAAATEKVLGESQSSSDEALKQNENSASKTPSPLGKKKKKKQEKNVLNTDPSKKDPSDSQVNVGTIINLMSVDSFKLSEICAYLHFLWAESPIQLAVCVFLLYRILGYTSFVSVVIMMLAMPLNYYIAQQFSRTQKRVMAATDARINTTNEVLQNIRIIKYFAWEQRFSAIVDEKRKVELRALRNRFIVWTLAAGFWFGMPLFIAFFSFMLYTIVEKKPLIPSVAFTALSLFGILRIPLDQLADMIAHVQESKVSVDRIEEFLTEEETEKYEQLANHDQDENGEPIIALKNATLTWGSKNGLGKTAFCLLGIDVRFRVGGLNVVAGPTGSGKTSLLMALLGEMTLLEGSISLPGGRSREDLTVNQETGMTESVAYCAQQAWLVNDNIKQNILFAAPYDAKRYKDVIRACALERDLEILDDGDATLVGEKGIALSGGQKQRISLARALYSTARHVLLDDCLSAVDSHTAKHIFEHCIMGPLMFGRTCILVTHNVALCVPFSQHVVVLNNGKVATQGPPEEVMSSEILGEEASQSKPSSSNATRHHSRIHSSTGVGQEGSKVENGHVHQPDSYGQEDSKATTSVMGGNNKASVRTESKTTGRVKIPVIKMYLAAMGPWYFWVAVFAFFVGQQIASIATTVWIRQWANSYSTRRVADASLSNYASFAHQRTHEVHYLQSDHWKSSINGWGLTSIILQPSRSFDAARVAHTTDSSVVNPVYYLGVYALLGFVYVAVAMGREGLVFYGSLVASGKLHSRLLVSVTRAKFKFFDSTPLGQLMNRFSKDLEAIDQEVAPYSVGLLGCMATIISVVILISIITPGFLIAAVFISVTYFGIAKFYLSSSTDLKRLESVQRSPLYQHLGETLSGATTIRAYGDQMRFVRDNHSRVDTHHRPFIYLWAANRWLALRVDVTGAMVSFFAGVFIILGVGKIDAGAAGLSLTYAVTFTENVLWLVRLYSANEQNMNSVERVKEYLDVEQEAKAIISDSRPDGDWPSQGNIDFINYTTRYRNDLKPVLKQVTFSIQAGQKVGIVGRTGAGKSSLTLALFRGLEADEGKIVIDGVDIGSIGLQDLREAITIVPQDPTLFTGTIRSNLDPFGLFTDEEIFEALRQVQLVDAPGSTVPLVPTNPSAPTTATSTRPDTPPTSEDVDDRDGDNLTLSKKTTNSRENANLFTNLASPVAESGSNLSQGQRQLLCLARALLKAPRVLVMDEATASIDYATDAKIQDTLRTVKGSTIITIAHRLQTIIDYDKVLVLEKGAVVEYDSPWALLSNEKSVFRGMCETSGDLETLLEGARVAEEKKNLIEI